MVERVIDPALPAGAPHPRLAVFQELFPRIFANAVDGICLTSTDGRIHAANPAACRIFGRTEEEICRLGRDGVMDRSDPRLVAAVDERRRTGRSQSVLTVVRPDGTRVPIEITSTVLTEPGPSSPAVIFFRDVSERVRAEEALASERALLDRVISSLHDAILVVDARTRLIVRANPAVERILGWPAAELVGRDTSALYATGEEFERVGRLARESFAASGFFSGDMDLRRRDGTAVPVRFFTRPVSDAEGTVTIVVSVLHDLTEERRAEAERARLQAVLFQAQKLESLGVLAGGLAHDMNNLLAAMLGNASLAASALPGGDPARAALDDIAASARQAAELVRQLLAYSGRSTGALARVDLAAGVLETTQLLRASVPRKVALRIDLPAAPLPVAGDAAQLRQVVVNLVLNAGEALGDRAGRVAVTAGVESCGEGHPTLSLAEPPLPPGRYAWIEVADDGPGMAPEVARRALDPFFTTKGLGRGLGLAAVAGIVRVHRGALELDTAPGRGTRVRVWIPAAPEEPARASTPAASRSGGGSKALVVEDEPLVRRAARRLLESAGYAVTEAADGVEAVELFRERAADFDVVLLDLCMPHMSGDETFAALRKIRPDVPVVLSSGYADAERFERLLAEPRVRFAPKPYDRAELLEALGAVRS
jgi:PAS domain S-box-containing protein